MKAVGKTLRDIISEDEKDQIIFGYEILSQPDPSVEGPRQYPTSCGRDGHSMDLRLSAGWASGPQGGRQ